MKETIVALATPPGKGAIGIIRLSGDKAIDITSSIFKGKSLKDAAGHTLHYGHITDEAETVVDEVVLSLYRAPKSYTGEDVIEISCHGSDYVLQRVIELCVANGAEPAQPGEFTKRAFLNGKMDLTQSEAVADLIASQSEASHRSAMHQLRGGFSSDLKKMRDELINFSALIELELDFSQEDVEFADRTALTSLINNIGDTTARLIESFRLGNAVKNGISVAIIGKPNAGKSTLLNALLNDDRAIVSDIAGTTRDTIEEVINLDGILYRFIDTAGIRAHTQDVIEQKGIERSLQKAEQADIVLYLVDGSDENNADHPQMPEGSRVIYIINKTDVISDERKDELNNLYSNALFITAKSNGGIEDLKATLRGLVVSDEADYQSTIVTNARHHSALMRISDAIKDIQYGMESSLPGDLLSHHIRQALHYIGELTGEIQIDRDILGTIFGKFCIGK